jgi:hypothetical protein
VFNTRHIPPNLARVNNLVFHIRLGFDSKVNQITQPRRRRQQLADTISLVESGARVFLFSRK